jgi:hypothetical protein
MLGVSLRRRLRAERTLAVAAHGEEMPRRSVAPCIITGALEMSPSNLTMLCWLISDSWLPFLEIDSELVLPEVLEQGVTLSMHVLRPYVSEAGHARGA